MILKVRGKKKIQGNVRISGSKNSAVAIICASTMADEEVTLRNIPNITDVTTLIEIIQEQGFSVVFKDNVLRIKQITKINPVIKSEKVTNLRGTYYFMGAFLSKLKKISIKQIGGCNLGYRPINYHLDGFKKMNVKIKEKQDVFCLKGRKIVGNIIDLPFASVGATINIMLAATKAKGNTIINNAALEPEIIDVGNFLNSMGANVTGQGTSTIKITGVKYLHTTDYTIYPDRIEAGTYMILGAISEGTGITLENINPNHLKSLINVLEKSNCEIIINHKENKLSIRRLIPLNPVNVIIGPYPEFPTDLGPLLTSFLTQVPGTSTITETIFLERFAHVKEIKKMGADISVSDNIITINGPTKLKSAIMKAYDLRCAASLVLASCTNRGLSTIENIDYFFRGYENPIEKLTNLGVYVKLLE